MIFSDINLWKMIVFCLRYPTKSDGTCVEIKFEDAYGERYDAYFRENCSEVYKLLIRWVSNTLVSLTRYWMLLKINASFFQFGKYDKSEKVQVSKKSMRWIKRILSSLVPSVWDWRYHLVKIFFCHEVSSKYLYHNPTSGEIKRGGTLSSL